MCFSFILPFLLPFPLYLFFKLLGFLFSYKKCNKYFPTNMTRSFIVSFIFLVILQFINYIVRSDTYFSIFTKLHNSLEFQGWFIDYKGVLFVSLITYGRFWGINPNLHTKLDFFITCFLIIFFHDIFIPIVIFLLCIFRQFYRFGDKRWIIFYIGVVLYQLYNWLKIVIDYDLINHKCFLDGFIDISSPEKLYITMTMIITYGLQVLLFSETMKNKLIMYIFSVIAFMNGTIALSLYLIYYELFL